MSVHVWVSHKDISMIQLFLWVKITCGCLVLTDKCVSDLSLQYEYIREDTGQKSAQSSRMVMLMVWDLEPPDPKGTITWLGGENPALAGGQRDSWQGTQLACMQLASCSAPWHHALLPAHPRRPISLPVSRHCCWLNDDCLLSSTLDAKLC